jgi:hypothetical protein
MTNARPKSERLDPARIAENKKGDNIVTNQKQKQSPRVIVPRPERMRRPGREGFGWLDARLHKQGWFSCLTPEDIATYTFLCLVANQQGVSWYRRNKIQQAMCINEDALRIALKRLYNLDMVAYCPFSRHASDGFHQVLSLPPHGPLEAIF